MRAAVAAALWLGLAGMACAQEVALPPGGMPPQVIPEAADPGTPTFTVAGDAGTYGGGAAADGTVAPVAYATTGGGAALAQLQAQSYGQTALDTAARLGVNGAATAAFASAESGFRNVPNAAGTTSATGPWQITQGTWNDTVARNGLPYTSADIGNPDAQAVVSNYVIRQYGGAVSQEIGRVATAQETYGAYVFGPTAGARIAGADASTPMANVVPTQMLANNGMQTWTVGDWQNFSSARLGSAAGQPIFASGG